MFITISIIDIANDKITDEPQKINGIITSIAYQTVIVKADLSYTGKERWHNIFFK